MEDIQQISLNEIKKKLNRKSAIIDFFREMGKAIYNLLILQGTITQIFPASIIIFASKFQQEKKKYENITL